MAYWGESQWEMYASKLESLAESSLQASKAKSVFLAVMTRMCKTCSDSSDASKNLSAAILTPIVCVCA